jgi:hypothetical protein
VLQLLKIVEVKIVISIKYTYSENPSDYKHYRFGKISRLFDARQRELPPIQRCDPMSRAADTVPSQIIDVRNCLTRFRIHHNTIVIT